MLGKLFEVANTVGSSGSLPGATLSRLKLGGSVKAYPEPPLGGDRAGEL